MLVHGAHMPEAVLALWLHGYALLGYVGVCGPRVRGVELASFTAEIGSIQMSSLQHLGLYEFVISLHNLTAQH